MRFGRLLKTPTPVLNETGVRFGARVGKGALAACGKSLALVSLTQLVVVTLAPNTLYLAWRRRGADFFRSLLVLLRQ